MFLRSLTAPLTTIRGIGPVLVPRFARLGIRDAAGLLCHYPRDWEDRSRRVPIKDFHRSRVCTEVTVIARDWIGFGRMRALKVHVEDESGRAALLCFNRPWMEKQLVPGRRYRLCGHFYYKYREIQSSSFEIEPIVPGELAGFGRILPVYPLSAGLTQAMLRRFVSRALEQYAQNLENELPAEIIERDRLLPKAAALKAVHFPASALELELAKKTLIYEELFYLEIMVGRRAIARKKSAASPVSPARFSASDRAFTPPQKRLLERLPFSLTAGQEEAVADINRDMAHNDAPPMARLLQGDVGSGKTLVSFLAALRAVEDRGQAAIMAPTELLARQHAENAARLLEPLGLRIAFLTGNIKAAGRKELLRSLSLGEIDIVVGTHALFSKDVHYKNLTLVVIDEQHRFGVTQRSLIMAKGGRPHLLMMSATPIPRTLALTVFGDMDVSVIRDLPPGRKPVKTHLAKESSEGRVYGFVRGEIAAGRQAYFVYPLIEGGVEADLKDAVSMADRLAREVFPDFSLALVHSKLDEEKKRLTMDRFRAGEIKILVATSVVEVGVDVPNASCMVIEHAERFGLSALHQLRGRVGRGGDQSYCFLVYSDELTEDGKARLKVMLENTDGFVIAEEDLKLRGPGQIAGIEQSGYLDLGIANPVRDAEALARARTDAFAILEMDPGLLLPQSRVVARVLEEAPPFGEVAL
ncbi:MAG: ATP-dependent DNA helicase RecG [Treponema sp.]|jgi:ATP-dependent DNA helicase RecG|nr:ATP-dependent DNA helicase RecG [Treponema sp.]